jgi:hypothetical protein
MFVMFLTYRSNPEIVIAKGGPPTVTLRMVVAGFTDQTTDPTTIEKPAWVPESALTHARSACRLTGKPVRSGAGSPGHSPASFSPWGTGSAS